MTDNDRNFIRLLLRSADIGEGWRQVSERVWPLVLQVETKDLIELDEVNRRVRLSSEGEIIARYAL